MNTHTHSITAPLPMAVLGEFSTINNKNNGKKLHIHMMIIYLCVSASKAHAYNAFDNTVGRLSSDNVYYNCLGPSWKYIYIFIITPWRWRQSRLTVVLADAHTHVPRHGRRSCAIANGYARLFSRIYLEQVINDVQYSTASKKKKNIYKIQTFSMHSVWK